MKKSCQEQKRRHPPQLKIPRRRLAASTTPTEAQPLPMKLDVRINSIKPNGAVRATASVNMNDCFAVKNLKVMDGKNGMFVSMPSYKSPTTGEYREHCFPVTKEFRDQLNNAVIGAYQQALAQSQQTALQGIMSTHSICWSASTASTIRPYCWPQQGSCVTSTISLTISGACWAAALVNRSTASCAEKTRNRKHH